MMVSVWLINLLKYTVKDYVLYLFIFNETLFFIKLTVFRPFFIKTNLPYSVKRGEKLALQILVFNYMPVEQTVSCFILKIFKP